MATSRALVPTVGASLLLHAALLLLMPKQAPVPLPVPPVLVDFGIVAPKPEPKVEPAPPQPVKAHGPAKRVAPPAPPAAPVVRDLDGEAPAPAVPEPPPLVFKAPFTGQPPTQQPPAAEERAAAPVVEAPAKLSSEVKPRYPDAARLAEIEGAVVLRVVIGADGRVEHIDVLETPGHGLEQAAIEAVRRATFQPATRNGVPARSTITYRYVFELY